MLSEKRELFSLLAEASPMQRRLRAVTLVIALLLSLHSPVRAQPEWTPPPVSKLVVLDVAEASSGWVDKDRFTNFFVQEVRRMDLQLEVVILQRIEDWEKLLEEGPSDVVVVNAHGEVIPLPSSYRADWCAFLGRLARMVRDKGWVLVNPVGYAFWAVGNSKVPEIGSVKIIGEEGLSCFTAELGLTATAWPPVPESEAYGKPSELARRLFDVLGYDMPASIPVPRPLRLFNGSGEILPLWSLLEMRNNVTAYGFAVHRVGQGYLLWGDLHGGVTDEIAAQLTAAAIAYFAEPDVVSRPPALKRSQLYAIAFAGAGAALAVILIALRTFKGKRR
jgi:hypothetical protein